MSRLPTDFVKAPAPAAADPAPARSTKRRAGATAGKSVGKVAAKAAHAAASAATATVAKGALALTGEVVLVLRDDERRALGAALDELRAAGHEITLEQMVSRVIGEWMARRAAPPSPRRALEAVVARLREFARSPLATFRELEATLRRTVRTAAHAVSSVRG